MRKTILIGLAMVGAAAVFASACSDIDRVPKGQADMQSLKTALDAYKLDTGDFPTTERGLAALRHKPAGVRGWAGPYVQQEPPKDVSGHDYIYAYPGQVSVRREAR